jgi:hypothetical protein
MATAGVYAYCGGCVGVFFVLDQLRRPVGELHFRKQARSLLLDLCLFGTLLLPSNVFMLTATLGMTADPTGSEVLMHSGVARLPEISVGYHGFDGGRSHWYAYVDIWRWQFAIACLAALGIALANQPRSVWPRLFKQLPSARLGWLRFRGVGLLTRFDRRVLLRHPIIWATRLHLSPVQFLSFWLAATAFSALIGVGARNGLADSVGVGGVVGLLVWPYVWLTLRRRDAALAPTISARVAIGSKFCATLLVPLFGACVMMAVAAAGSSPFDVETLAVLWLAQATNAALVVSASLIRTYEGAVLTILPVAVLPLWMGVAELCVGQNGPLAKGFWSSALLAYWVALLWPRERPVSMLRRRAVASLLTGVPCVLIYGSAKLVKGSGWQGVTMALTAVIGFSYLVVLPPAVKLLARAHYEPKAQ